MSVHACSASHGTLAQAPAARALASAAHWTLSEVACSAGPADPVFEERHERVAMALVVEGSFRYRSDRGSAVLYPGAVLLGNAGASFECSHDHTTGDRCLAIHLEREQFAEVAASTAGSGSFAFAHAVLPAGPKLLPALSALETLHGGARDDAAAELVLAFAEAVTTLCARTAPRSTRAPAARESRRIGAVLQRVAEEPQAAWDLDALAAAAAMSKYHFLRCFRRLCGLTPHQYLLERRLRRAARCLRNDPQATVAAIAFEAGFRDLSSFNHQFRAAFGATPGAFRARGAGGLRKE